MNNTFASINESLEGTTPKKDPSAGVASKKESVQRRKDREREYEIRKNERAERKKSLEKQWQEHRKDHSGDKIQPASKEWWS